MLRLYLLAACISVFIASVLYLFFFNRLVAAFIGLFLRVRYWKNGGSSIWIQIGSIHFSILAGRILLKDVVYHSSNQTIRIVKAQISWRYWLRVPATEDDLNHAHVGGEDFNQTHVFPSCRIKVSVQGFEWFLYNRTAAYDHILSQMQAKAPPAQPPDESEPRRHFSHSSGLEGFYPPSAFASIKAPPIIHAAINWIKRQMPYLDPKDLLPISIEVFKLAITCGNLSTPSLMVAECHRADGTFGIVRARSNCDLYKQLLNFRFQNALIHFVENERYQASMTGVGRAIRARTESSIYADRIPLNYLSFGAFMKVWKGLKLYSALLSSNRQASSGLKGSAFPSGRRSSDESNIIGGDFTKVEYAIERRILEAPVLELSYYVDVVGDVPAELDGPRGIGLESYDIGNGDLPPEWGVDLVIRHGTLRYGPWADRQRAHLQRTFFPPTFHDMEVSQRLKAGDKRIWTALKIFVELREETTLNIPFREASKNWQWDGLADIPKSRTREYAFLHATAGDSSSISFLIPMVIGPDGYESRLEVHLDTIEVTSSLNDIKVVSAESCRVSAALPSPLKWNAERLWSFSVSLRQPVIFLLRDHINMITDLARDWTSGEPTEWHHFVPTVYSLELSLHHSELNLYANDQNIIDKPLVKDENTIINLRAPRLRVTATIPSNVYIPEASTITFAVDAPDVSVCICLPKWNTFFQHGQGKEQQVLQIDRFRLDGTYYYWANVHPDNVEQLRINISAGDVAMKTIGWAIRYFMVLRDNYLGSFTHFSTLTEYLEKWRRGRSEVGDPIEKRWRSGKSNMLQVELRLMVQRGSLLLSAGLSGFEKYTNATATGDVGTSLYLAFPELQLDLRLHDYFMEMSLNVDELKGCIMETCIESDFFLRRVRPFKETLVVDGIEITTNRLFGPAPRTLAYVCVWEIGLGHIKIVATPLESRALLAVGDAFRMHFTDIANAPAEDFGVPLYPDLTYLKLSLKALNATCLAGAVAIDLDLPKGFTLQTNDLHGQLCGRVLSVMLPHISVKGLVTSDASRGSWSEAAAVDFDIVLDSFTCPKTGDNPQGAFLQEQDQLTQRAQYLLSQITDARAHFGPKPPQASARNIRPRPPHRTHRNDLYLPPLVLPRFVRAQSSGFQRQQQYPSPIPRWSQLSESDGENISEADRDARLARSRIFQPIRTTNANDSELSMSDDESDDVDLTDDSSSESEWSVSTGENTKRILHHYEPLTRRYKERLLDDVSGREGSPFVVLSAPSFSSFQKPDDLLTPPPVISPHKAELSADTHSSSLIRVQCTCGLVILVVPLLLILASRLRDEIEQHDLSPELTLDTVLAQQLSNFLSLKKDPSSSMALDILIQSSRVQVMEHVFLQKRGLSSLEDSQAIDVVLLGSFSNLRVKSQAQPTALSAQATFDELSIGLRRLPPAKGVIFESPSPEFWLSMYAFQAYHAPNRIDVSCGNLAVQMGPSDPEYIASLLFTTRNRVRLLLDIHQEWRSRSNTSLVRLVRHIVWTTRNIALVDPLSIIQPSFLVQHGLPQALRTNGPLKFWFYLRQWLRQCDQIADSEQWGGDQEVQQLIKSRLDNLTVDLDTLDKMYTSLWDLLFPPENPSPAKPSTALPSVTCGIGAMRLTLLSGSSISPSYITGSMLRLQYQFNSLRVQPHSASHASLPSQTTQQIATLSINDIALFASPHLVDFARGAIRVKKYWQGDVTLHDRPTQGTRLPLQTILIVHVGSMNIRAGAENLTFEIASSSLELLLSSLSRPDIGTESTSGAITFDGIHILARSKAASTGPSEQDILASLSLANGKFDAAQRSDPKSKILRVIFGLEEILVSVPRSAIRLYRFIEEWRADFLPSVEATAETLVSELKRNSMSTISKPSLIRSSEQPSTSFFVNGRIARFGVTLQVMRGTWLSWTVEDTTAFVSSSPTSPSKRTYNFGLQLGSQRFTITYKSDSMDHSTGSPRVKLILPALTLTGHQRKGGMELLGTLDFVNIMVKPTHMDTFLSVQQKFGQDFTDLLDIIRETRQKHSGVSEPQQATGIPGKVVVHVNVKGFRVGLGSPSSVFYLECQNVWGDIVREDDELKWKVQLRNLALVLARRTGMAPDQYGFFSNEKSAFVIVDITASASDGVLNVSVPKINAVMQPSSVSELGDFIDYQQAELLSRRQRRAAEVEAFKEKTRSILKTFESQTPNPDSGEPSWLSKHTILVEIERIGVAFPLASNQSTEMLQWSSEDETSGEAAQMSTRELSFQFVNQFRQRNVMDFNPDNHRARNRLVYPQMKAHLRSDTSLSKHQIWITANVTGFILDLDCSISDWVFSLIDVYHQGRERMERLASNLPHSAAPPRPEPVPLVDEQTGSNIFGALVFESGEIRVHGRATSSAFSDDVDDSLPVKGTEVIRLPVVSAWIEYRASSNVATIPRSPPLSILIFKAKIHSSRNTLRPTLLPFISDITDSIQARLRATTHHDEIHNPPDSLEAGDSGRSSSPAIVSGLQETSKLQINFSLRIDQSSLEFTCQPDVNVLAALRWESGGFVVSISPGINKVTFTGSVDGLTMGLRHGFLSEDCVNLAARNLAFSLALAKTANPAGDAESTVSLVVSTDLSGGIRFSRLQDILCFQAVWLDRIPMIASEHTSPPASANVVPVTPAPEAKQEVTTAIIIRIRSIEVNVDLGPSISNVTLDLEDTFIRTKFSERSRELSLSVADVAIFAKGNVSGHVRVPDCIFHTISSNGEALLSESASTRLLELTMTSGPLSAELESEHQRLLVYRADPVQVDIHDDWSLISSSTGDEDRPLLLAFTVHGRDITALATISTIPKLMLYVNRFKANIAFQRAAASHESEAFRIAQGPKPDKPLTEVASALLQSARTKLKEAETDISHLVRQQMSFRLETLRLILFPRSMADTELAQLVGRDVHASLIRTVQDCLPSHREVHLSFTSLDISRFTQLQSHVPSTTTVFQDGSWISSLFRNPLESNIVGLPSMKMLMITDESVQDLTARLVYDFYSTFQGRDKSPEDIYITLNMALYAWLTGLRKNLSRELEQVQVSTSTQLSGISGASSRKRAVGTEVLPGSAAATMHSADDGIVSSSLTRNQTRNGMSVDDGNLGTDPGSSAGKWPTHLHEQEGHTPSTAAGSVKGSGKVTVLYEPRERKIQRLTMRQLGEATPDVMHPFFKKSGFNLEDSLPQYVHEYATMPLEKIMEALLALYSRQLRTDKTKRE